MKISLDNSLILKENIGEHGLVKATFEKQTDISVFEEVTRNILENNYEFIQILHDDGVQSRCQQLFEQKKWAKHLVVVGIGGSDLGGRMLQEALQVDHPPMPVSFVGDTTDPEQYLQLFQRLNPQETVVNVISKSGSTTETMVGYFLLKEKMKSQLEQWQNHFVFTTSKDSLLYTEGQQQGIACLTHEEVGGRFSVLSSVGMFPALAMGIDITQLRLGAKHMLAQLAHAAMDDNLAWELARSLFLLEQTHNLHTVVMFPYIWRLSLFGNWFRQLWAESLGKDGKGILPIKAIGPADQHSQLQYYTQGQWLSSFLFVEAQHYDAQLTIQADQSEPFQYLHACPVEDVIKFEAQATRISLANNGRPSMTITIEQLDNTHLGALIVLFETAVVYLGRLYGINPFDQPGVEESKDYLYGLLGRAGYEQKAAEIALKQQKILERKISISI